MSKSTLSIAVPFVRNTTRTVEVPCRLPDSFTFSIFVPSHGVMKCTSYLDSSGDPSSADIHETEAAGYDGPEMDHAASDVLRDAKSRLGLDGIGRFYESPLPAIATAYEAEVAAYAVGVLAYHELPRRLFSMALVPTHPSESALSPAALMLRRYVEYVFEEACAAQTESAEAQAKVTPIQTVTP